MDEKLKSENMQKRAVFGAYVILSEQSGQAGVENGAMLTTFIQIYFRMHHFVVKVKKKICLRRQGGIDPLTKILRSFLSVGQTFLNC